MTLIMEKLQLTGQNLGRVFNSRSGCLSAMQLPCFETKRSALKLKTQPKQLLGYLPLDIALPALIEKPNLQYLRPPLLAQWSFI
jgi:hypothetical protein